MEMMNEMNQAVLTIHINDLVFNIQQFSENLVNEDQPGAKCPELYVTSDFLNENVVAGLEALNESGFTSIDLYSGENLIWTSNRYTKLNRFTLDVVMNGVPRYSLVFA